MEKLAIIGAGLSGLTLARSLKGNADVTIFEKSRGAGGRMATRRGGGFEFDHGAQYFTATSDDFRAFVKPHLASGLLKDWQPALATIEKGRATSHKHASAPLYLAAPTMNALAKAMAQDVEIAWETQITRVEKSGDDWRVVDAGGNAHGPFAWIVSTAPAPQTENLLPRYFTAYDTIRRTRMTGCYSLMLGFAEPLDLNWDGAFVNKSPIRWMAVGSSKPGRPNRASLLIQSTNDWAEQRLETNRKTVAAVLKAECAALIPKVVGIDPYDGSMPTTFGITGLDLSSPAHEALHRWRHANVARPSDHPFHLDETLQPAACGDWCLEGRVEAAFTSGKRLAAALKPLLA